MKFIKSLVLLFSLLCVSGGCSYKNNQNPPLNELRITYNLSFRVDKNDELLSSIKESIKVFLQTKNYYEVSVNIETDKLIVIIRDRNDINSIDVNSALLDYSTWEISIRDSMDNLLATKSMLFFNEMASLNENLNAYGEKSINLHVKDVQLLEEITASVSQGENPIIVIWFGFEEGVDCYQCNESSKKIIYDASVSESLTDEIITINYFEYNEIDYKNIVNVLNAAKAYRLSNPKIEYAPIEK